MARQEIPFWTSYPPLGKCPRNRIKVTIVAVALGLGGSALSFRFLNVPFFWAALNLFGASVAGAVVSRSTGWKVAFVNAALLALVLAGFEGWAYREDSRAPVERDEVFLPDGSKVQRSMLDPLLGYAPRPATAARWRRFLGDELLFDVQYSIDAHGLRKTPPPAVDTAACVLFLGDSFTFGAGVNDNETLPSNVAKLAADAFRVYNLGYSGYGPHHALATLQSGVIARLGCSPRYAFFLAIPEHAIRVARVRAWDVDGPRYVLQGDGTVRQSGKMADGVTGRQRWILRQIRKSHLLERMVYQPLDLAIRQHDLELMARVLSASRDLLEAQSPPAELHVLLWDKGPATGRVAEALLRAGLRLHRVSAILPGFAQNPAQWELGPHETHPNATAYSLLARYINSQILAPRPP